MYKTYRVRLTPEERAHLEDLLSKGKAAARTLTHARILLKADEGVAGPRLSDEVIAEMLDVIARDQVPDRPGRIEPRAVKRRPKPFPLLNKPRDQFQEVAHRNRYWKNNPRKSRA